MRRNEWAEPVYDVYDEANKDTVPEQGNADLIQSDAILEIPSMAREIRSGTWDPASK